MSDEDNSPNYVKGTHISTFYIKKKEKLQEAYDNLNEAENDQESLADASDKGLVYNNDIMINKEEVEESASYKKTIEKVPRRKR